MTAQHTPAPWELRQSTSGYWFIDYEQGGEGYTLTKLECGERDARLIASAPDLLAVLQEAVRVLDYAADALDAPEASHFRATIADARAAIAKATGETA